MVDIGYITPTNKIVLAGMVQSVEMTCEDAGMKPGMLVMHGTTNNEVKMNTSGAIAYGWLGYEQTALMFRPATVDTAYTTGGRGAVLHGPGMVLVARLKANESVVMGDKLVGDAAGELIKWTPVPADAATAEEDVVGTAMEDGGTDSAVNLIVRSKI